MIVWVDPDALPPEKLDHANHPPGSMLGPICLVCASINASRRLKDHGRSSYAVPPPDGGPDGG